MAALRNLFDPFGDDETALGWTERGVDAAAVVDWEVWGPDGWIYYVVYPAAESEPSAAQIKAGLRQSGSAAVASGVEPARSFDGEQVWQSLASGLTAGTSYDVSFVWTDGANDSAVESGTFSTSAGGGEGALAVTLDGIGLSASGALALSGTSSKALDGIGLGAAGAVALTGSATRTLDDAALTGAGAVALAGSMGKTLDGVSLAATGELSSGVSGALAATLADATLSSAGTVALSGALGRTLDGVSIAASGAVALDGSTTRTLDGVGLSAAGAVALTGALSSTLDGLALSASSLLVDGGSGSLLRTLGDASLAATGELGPAPATQPETIAPGYSRGDGRSHRYRVRVGRRWIEVDPLDDASLRAVYIAAEQEAQKAAESRVAAPRRSAARVVAAAAPKAAGVDYAAVRAEAQRISEMVRAVYAEALQRELIGRLMREQIERDDEDDIELLLMV